ncbi:hypothetical protein SAMN06295998_11291 [Primorskyibacter flagellatus]|uniref:Uncharacterized protein n=2 Tax=Primorskyibacter flagellatus TaxID=1387277 RepID=A0A1W2DCP8_9RHOB|nr:hypothetical protein SAMN06295998_11291 [Primorskyibacter flagellatus]
MTGQLRSFEEIMKDRLKATQDIAAANAEQMRLNQKSSGLLVLDLKVERDGIVDSTHENEHARTEAAVEDNIRKIDRLERELSALDEELEATMKKEG